MKQNNRYIIVSVKLSDMSPIRYWNYVFDGKYIADHTFFYNNGEVICLIYNKVIIT
jgi:hypothetical protein